MPSADFGKWHEYHAFISYNTDDVEQVSSGWGTEELLLPYSKAPAAQPFPEQAQR
jgi:hypothetical protein